MSVRDTLLSQLNAMQIEMQRCQLWQSESPTEQALSSEQPFCVDTLLFEQWLQFVFIPKLRYMAENGLPLPTKISVHPMAEEAFKPYQQTQDLLQLILDVDNLLSNQ